jgi:hypothetical protein
MAITNFIPTIWSAALLEPFRSAQYLVPAVNHQYEGELESGNTVKVTAITSPSIQNYATSRTLTIDALSDTTQSLVINKEDAISFKVDDVDRVQSSGSFEPVTRDAAKALAENAELNLLTDLKTNGTSAGTAAITTAALAYAAVVAIRTNMVKAKVPNSDRILAVSPEFAALLFAESSKLTTAEIAGDGELRNGVLGKLLGFTVVEHPLLTHTSNRPCAVGLHGPSVAYVGQIQKVEAGRMELAFADYVRALNVYGTKVLRATSVQTWLPSA